MSDTDTDPCYTLTIENDGSSQAIERTPMDDGQYQIRRYLVLDHHAYPLKTVVGDEDMSECFMFGSWTQANLLKQMGIIVERALPDMDNSELLKHIMQDAYTRMAECMMLVMTDTGCLSPSALFGEINNPANWPVISNRPGDIHVAMKPVLIELTIALSHIQTRQDHKSTD